MPPTCTGAAAADYAKVWFDDFPVGFRVVFDSDCDSDGSGGVVSAAFILKLARVSAVFDGSKNARHREVFTDWSLQGSVTSPVLYRVSVLSEG